MKLASVVLFSALLVTAFSASANAATFVIGFGGVGGSAPFTYEPSAITARVGDTIVWSGNFAFHPLSSETVPSGAQPFHNATGSTFTYILAQPGHYDFVCDNHKAMGMVGSIEVSAALDVAPATTAGITLEQNYPNPVASSTTRISYRLAVSGKVELSVYDTKGTLVRSLAQSGHEGENAAELSLDGLANGTYIYEMRSQGITLRRELAIRR